VFFSPTDLPFDRAMLERVLLNVMGSPDIRQIDGLGGATPQTSKVAIVGRSFRPDADVDYTFAQVDISRPLVDWGGNCGNISSAVGPFAINSGLVPGNGDSTVVRIHNTNTGKIIAATVPLAGGRAAVEGDFLIAGVPSSGARIDLEFVDPGGSVTGRLLPTGNVKDAITLADGRTFEVSIVDAGNPTVFIAADALGVVGTESPAEIEAHPTLRATLEAVRGQVAAMLGLVGDPADAAATTPGLPKIAFVSSPASYSNLAGTMVEESDVDLVVRSMSMGAPHRAYQITAGVCTGAASVIPGTVVHDLVRPAPARNGAREVILGHPFGTMPTTVRYTRTGDGGHPVIDGVAVARTARAILDGQVHVAERLFQV
jgi:2-methylaconitate cis-trans-isomerase PrpF